LFQVHGAGLEVDETHVHVGGVRYLHANHLFGKKAKVEGLGRGLGRPFDGGALGRAHIRHGRVVDVVVRV
jgi:hypothetical protein